jgi:hypothetical protein
MIVAYRLAAANNAAFRLVVPASLTRIFAVTGLTAVLAIYPTLAEALPAAVPGQEPVSG